MNGIEAEAEAEDWTPANIKKLLAAMKTSIPEQERKTVYTKGLKALDWNKVAFPPFSPEECQIKWTHILFKMQKTRTLTELIVEAEDIISSPVQNNKSEKRTKAAQSPSTKPPYNGYNLFCKEQLLSTKDISEKDRMTIWAQRWRDLSQRQKTEYSRRCRELKKQYSFQLRDIMTLNKRERQKALRKIGFKSSKALKKDMKLTKELPGEPEMPPRSSNAIFCKEEMEMLKKKFPNAKERFTMVSQKWKMLSSKEKAQYKEKTDQNFRKYLTELQKWFKTLTPSEQRMYRNRYPKKCQYLNDKLMDTEDEGMSRPSDSEDEDIEDSSDDEEDVWDCTQEKEEEEEDEEEEGDNMFDIY